MLVLLLDIPLLSLLVTVQLQMVQTHITLAHILGKDIVDLMQQEQHVTILVLMVE